ncbi:MAG: DoxX family membrane protein [Acidobacteria bacterium]|nr:DoxX family membrane protein [Acidobacteriota bacterium]
MARRLRGRIYGRRRQVLFPAEIGAGRFAKIGLPSPEVLGPFVGTVEIICGVLVLLGLLTRLAVIPLIVISGRDPDQDPKLLDKGFWSMAHDSRTDFSMRWALYLIVGAGRLSVDANLGQKQAELAGYSQTRPAGLRHCDDGAGSRRLGGGFSTGRPHCRIRRTDGSNGGGPG